MDNYFIKISCYKLHMLLVPKEEESTAILVFKNSFKKEFYIIDHLHKRKLCDGRIIQVRMTFKNYFFSEFRYLNYTFRFH